MALFSVAQRGVLEKWFQAAEFELGNRWLQNGSSSVFKGRKFAAEKTASTAVIHLVDLVNVTSGHFQLAWSNSTIYYLDILYNFSAIRGKANLERT